MASASLNLLRPLLVRRSSKEHEVRSTHSKKQGKAKYVVRRNSRHPFCSSAVVYRLHLSREAKTIFSNANEIPRLGAGWRWNKSFPFFNKVNARGKAHGALRKYVLEANNSVKKANDRFTRWID
jgi:hypothetical protein